MDRSRILVVEDQAVVARDIRNRLIRLGYEPAGQTDRAEDAVRLAAELRPDMVLMDVTLAGEMNGITAAGLIRKQSSIPVVFLTAHADDGTMDSAKVTEPFGYVIKPFQDHELRSAIEMGLFRSRSERALRESEQRFRLFFENSLDAVLVTTPNGVILAANGEAIRLFGRTEVELRRMGCAAVLQPNDPQWIAALEERARTGRFRGELNFRRADGSTFPAEVSCAVYRGEDGVEHTSMVVRDITQRKAAEEALRRINERLEMAQIAAGTGVWDWDVETGQIEWSSELFRIFGIDSNKVPAGFESWRAALHPDDRVAAEKYIAESVQEGSMLNSEYRVVWPDGQVRWINALGRTRYDASGKPVRMSGLCIDITERKRTENALQSSERALRHAQAAARVGTYVFDIPGDRWSSTPVLDAIFGIESEFPHTAEGWMQLIHPAEREELLAYQRRVIERHERFEREYRIVRVADGAERWVLSLGEIEYDAQGSPLRMIGTTQDVTERKEAELALQRTKDQLQLTIDTVPSLIAQIDREHRFVVVNRCFEDWLKVKPEEVRGSLVRDFMGDEQWRHFGPLAERVLGGESISYVREHDFRDGSTRWIHSMIVPERDEHGTVLGYVVLATDVSAQKKAEATLRMQGAALEAAGSAVVICDADAAIQWVNPAFTALSGFGLDDVKGRDAWGFLAAEMPADAVEAMRSAIDAGVLWRGEILMAAKKNQVRVLDSAIAPVRDDTGAVIYVSIVGQDVTEQRRLETQLLRAQRLESVGRLASGLAHDLNNILLPVLLAPAFLRTVVRDPAALEMLDTVESSVKRGAEIIKQLLTFGRGVEARRAPVCLNQTVGDVMRIIKETFPRSVDVRCELPPGTRMVSANVTQLHQVIMNLCFNSRDAMGGFGKLTLRVEDVTLTPDQASCIVDGFAGRFHVLSVVDTGRGIPAEHLERVFEPFFTTKEIGEGSGLGLSTALGIVRGHKGFIEVRSEPGKGTEMRVHLPALEPT